MSLVVGASEFDLKRWIYPAKRMNEILTEAVKRGSLKKEDVPIGILADIAALCGILSNIDEPYKSQDPLLSARAFVAVYPLFSEILGDKTQPEDVDGFCYGCILIVELWKEGAPINGDGLEYMLFLSKFLAKMADHGENKQQELALGYPEHPCL